MGETLHTSNFTFTYQKKRKKKGIAQNTYANKWTEDKDVPDPDDQSFDKNKGCKFEFDQEYVFVNLKHTRFHQQAGFQIIQKAHQPYDLQQNPNTASSSNDESLKYNLQAVSFGVCTIQTILGH